MASDIVFADQVRGAYFALAPGGPVAAGRRSAHSHSSKVKNGSELILGILLILALAGPAGGQEPVAPSPPPQPEEVEDALYSPRGAFFRSIVLPGWGQAYVGAPLRGAVYFSLASGSVWMSFVSRRQLADARREQFWLRETGEIAPTEETDIAIAREQQFEDWAALSIFVFFFAGADAFVSAYLADFSERIGVRPAPNDALRIEATIPLGRPR